MPELCSRVIHLQVTPHLVQFSVTLCSFPTYIRSDSKPLHLSAHLLPSTFNISTTSQPSNRASSHQTAHPYSPKFHAKSQPSICLTEPHLPPAIPRRTAARSSSGSVPNGKVIVALLRTLADIRSSSNMLYPKEDRATSELLYVCRACHAVQKFDTNCTERKILNSTVAPTAGVTTDVVNDPTVGDDSSDMPCLCTMCGDALRGIKCHEPLAVDSDQLDYSIAQEEDISHSA
jgi:DNA-directed RNA polymerase subunit M/transcription elongation factor TFIIS